MKWLTAFALFLSVHLASATPIEVEKRVLAKSAPGPHGIDVSAYQPNVDWSSVKTKGNDFTYIKATEGTEYKNPHFSSQYSGATNAGLIRGAYHSARPNISSGAAQANFFVANGGNWKGDGITLPGALEINYNPYGPKCYGRSHAAIVAWVRDFSNAYHAQTSRYPVILASTRWWTDCTGNAGGFAKTNPLWIIHYSSKVGSLLSDYNSATFWQYSYNGIDGDSNDYFNGDEAALKRLALGH